MKCFLQASRIDACKVKCLFITSLSKNYEYPSFFFKYSIPSLFELFLLYSLCTKTNLQDKSTTRFNNYTARDISTTV